MEEIKQEPEYITPPPAAAVSSGLEDNVAGALAYITIIPAIIFLILAPYNTRPFIRFHAFQCLGIAVCSFVLSFIFGIIPILGWFICTVILCVVKAYNGVKFKLPFLGDFVEKLANS